MSRAEGADKMPRAMIHRRILDVAESNPDASIPAIAESVSGASPDLVDRVLEEYGDPAGESEQPTEASESAMATENGSTETVDGTAPDEQTVTLSDKQRTTLRAVHGNPGGSQGDIADELGVTRATVSRRLNSIPGFEWDEREAFAESVFDKPSEASTSQPENDPAERDPMAEPEVENEPGATSVSDTGPTSEQRDDAESNVETSASTSQPDAKPPLAALERRVSALETTTRDGSSAAPLPPDLAHKVVHACMESDRVTEDEELELLRVLLDD